MSKPPLAFVILSFLFDSSFVHVPHHHSAPDVLCEVASLLVKQIGQDAAAELCARQKMSEALTQLVRSSGAVGPDADSSEVCLFVRVCAKRK